MLTHGRTSLIAEPESAVIAVHLTTALEPRDLRAEMRALLEHAPSEGLARIADGEWIAAPIWDAWRPALEPRGLSRPQFVQIVAGYQNELRLWVVGERTWEHCIEGLAGRVVRRLPDAALNP